MHALYNYAVYNITVLSVKQAATVDLSSCIVHRWTSDTLPEYRWLHVMAGNIRLYQFISQYSGILQSGHALI